MNILERLSFTLARLIWLILLHDIDINCNTASFYIIIGKAKGGDHALTLIMSIVTPFYTGERLRYKNDQMEKGIKVIRGTLF